MRTSRSLIAAASCVLAFVAVPSQASADPAAVTITMTSIGPDLSFVPSEINLYDCKAGRPWMPFIWETKWSIDDPDAVNYPMSTAIVIGSSGRVAVTQGSKYVGSVRFASVNDVNESFPSPNVPIELSKSDLCELRKKGLGGPHVRYQLTLETASATARIKHYSSAEHPVLVNSAVVTSAVQGRPAARTKVPQATELTKVHIKRRGTQYIFSSWLRVQDSRGKMVKGPRGVKVGFSELGRGSFGESKTKTRGKVTFTKRVAHKGHKRKARIAAWTDTRTSARTAWFKHTFSEAAKIRW